MGKNKIGKAMRKKKYNSTLKKQFLGSLRKYASQLEEELRTVQNDPSTVVGKLNKAYQDTVGSSKRLSVLCAAIIKGQGGTIKVSKADLESFKGLLINIKWEAPEGKELKDAEEYVFSYDAVSEEEFQRQQQAAADSQAKAISKAQEAGQGPSNQSPTSNEPPILPVLASEEGTKVVEESGILDSSLNDNRLDSQFHRDQTHSGGV